MTVRSQAEPGNETGNGWIFPGTAIMIVVAAVAGAANLGLFLRGNWPLLLPLLLGFAGIYLLLPQVRRSRPAAGLLLGGLGLLLGALFAVRIEGPVAEKILFYVFSGCSIAGGVALITHKNPVYAALSFALVVLSSCGLFLLQGAPFLTAATIIVYAGAIVVTFLFVIMLAQQAGTSEADRRSREPFLACLAGFVLIAAVLCVLHKNYNTRMLDRLLGDLQAVADARTPEEAMAVLGDPEKRPTASPSLPMVDALSQYLPNETVANLEPAWQKIRQPKRFQELKGLAEHLVTLGQQRRVMHGLLMPAENLPLSGLSGVPANRGMIATEAGRLPEQLKARNVEAIGTALFTDYLLAVLLAGVLLLVATIGAIVIAARRPEGLR